MPDFIGAQGPSIVTKSTDVASGISVADSVEKCSTQSQLDRRRKSRAAACYQNGQEEKAPGRRHCDRRGGSLESCRCPQCSSEGVGELVL